MENIFLARLYILFDKKNEKLYAKSVEYEAPKIPYFGIKIKFRAIFITAAKTLQNSKNLCSASHVIQIPLALPININRRAKMWTANTGPDSE